MRNKQTAFTLVEVLIVVGIAVLVLSILFPAVSQLIDTSKPADAHNLISGWLTAAWTRARSENAAVALQFSRAGNKTSVQLFRKESTGFVVMPRFKKSNLPDNVAVVPLDNFGQPNFSQTNMQVCFLPTGQLTPSYASETTFFLYDLSPSPPEQLEQIRINYYTGHLIPPS